MWKDAKKEGGGPHAVGSGNLRQWDQHLEDPGRLTSKRPVLRHERIPAGDWLWKVPFERPREELRKRA